MWTVLKKGNIWKSLDIELITDWRQSDLGYCISENLYEVMQLVNKYACTSTIDQSVKKPSDMIAKRVLDGKIKL